MDLILGFSFKFCVHGRTEKLDLSLGITEILLTAWTVGSQGWNQGSFSYLQCCQGFSCWVPLSVPAIPIVSLKLNWVFLCADMGSICCLLSGLSLISSRVQEKLPQSLLSLWTWPVLGWDITLLISWFPNTGHSDSVAIQIRGYGKP